MRTPEEIHEVFKTILGEKSTSTPPTLTACETVAIAVFHLSQKAVSTLPIDHDEDGNDTAIRRAREKGVAVASALRLVEEEIEAVLARIAAGRELFKEEDWREAEARFADPLRKLAEGLKRYGQFRESHLGLGMTGAQSLDWHSDLQSMSDLFTGAMRSSNPEKEFRLSHNGPRARFLIWAIKEIYEVDVTPGAVVMAATRASITI